MIVYQQAHRVARLAIDATPHRRMSVIESILAVTGEGFEITQPPSPDDLTNDVALALYIRRAAKLKEKP